MAAQDYVGNADTFKCISDDIEHDSTKSIATSQSDLAHDYSELVIDNTLNEMISDYEGILESVPIAKTAVGVYKAYKGFSSLHFAKKLNAFIQKMNEHAASEEDVDWFKKRFSEGDKGQHEHIEYLLIVIDRYVGYDKPQMLAKLFIAFLDDYISWDELTCYAETIEKLLPSDYSILAESNICSHILAETPASILRLVGLGLMIEAKRPSAFVPTGNGHVSITAGSLGAVQKNEVEYSRTAFGSKLVDIVQGSYATK